MIFNYYRPRTVRGLINRDRIKRERAPALARRRRPVARPVSVALLTAAWLCEGARGGTRLEFSRVSFHNGTSIIIEKKKNKPKNQRNTFNIVRRTEI